MSESPASKERAAGKEVRAGAPMQASAAGDIATATSQRLVPWLARGVCVSEVSTEEADMFEGQPQAELDAILKSNNEFKQLYQRHKELDRQVLDAELGVLPIDDVTLARMKREKLAAKDRLTRLYESSH